MRHLFHSVRAALCALALAATGAQAHDAFFDATGPNAYLVRFADDGKPLAYPATKLTRVWGYDAAGRPLDVQRASGDGPVAVAVPAGAALLALEFDNGIHSRTTQGTVEKPMNEAPGAVSAVWAKKTGKYLVQWSPVAGKPLGLPLEIVPTVGTAAPKPGDVLEVTVLADGKPVPGVKVSRGEHASGETTDAAGRARYTVGPGRNFVWAERRTKVAGNPRHDSLAVATNLVFVAQ